MNTRTLDTDENTKIKTCPVWICSQVDKNGVAKSTFIKIYKCIRDNNNNDRRRHFRHATVGLYGAIRRHHPPQRTVLSQIYCFGECKVVVSQILLDGAEPCV